MSDVVLTEPHQIEVARLITLRSGLSLELQGMKRSKGLSCYMILKRDYGYKGTKQKVYEQACHDVDTLLGRTT